VDLEKLSESDFADLEVKVEKICCEFCEEKFFIPANLDLHVKRNHQSATENSKNESFKCLFCGKLFKTKDTYKNHLKFIHKDKAIRCKFKRCCKIFTTEISLQKHLSKDHFLNKPTNSVECKVCKIWLSSKNSLKGHMESRHATQAENVKLIQCKICCENFDSKAKLFRHIKENHEKEPIKCRLKPCHHYFPSKVEMENHFKNTHAIKCKFRNNLECVYCGKHYGESRRNMLIHVRKFHSKISIQCEKRGCALFFKSQEDLEKHKKEAHKKVEKHKKTVDCLYCQKVIWDKLTYAEHIKSQHLK